MSECFHSYPASFRQQPAATVTFHPFSVCFLAQTYPNKELVIVSEDNLDDVVPDHPGIRVLKCCPGSTVGTKRNIAIAAAKGDYICHWDSDDWSAPTRLETQLAFLTSRNVICTGYGGLMFFNETSGEAWKYINGDKTYACGTSLFYKREHALENPFLDLNVGEDTNFEQTIPEENLLTVDGSEMCVARDHAENTSPRIYKARSMSWKKVDAKGIAARIDPPKPAICLSLLTWNTCAVSVDALVALKTEATRLRQLGHEVHIVVVDNGSNDGTAYKLVKEGGFTFIANPTNQGSSVARNQIISAAKNLKADYLLFNDGDISIIPWSVHTLMSYMESQPPHLGVVGFDSYGYTDDPKRATKALTSLEGMKLFEFTECAWTQYGLFRVSAFRDVLFPVYGAYGQPGWGCEDNYLQYEFNLRGIRNECLCGATYLHRHAHHSIRECQKAGFDAQALGQERVRLFIERFSKCPQFKNQMKPYQGMTIPKEHFIHR